MKNKLVIILSIVLVILLSVIIILGINLKNKTTFSKPKFDDLASSTIPEDLNYEDNILKLVDGYSFYISARPKIEEEYLIIDFVSMIDNNTWIKVRIFDDENKVMGETGLVKPGEYLEKVLLTKALSNNDNISYKIIGYEMDTYMSAGTVDLKTRVGE